jgi:hypothetical protein
MPFLTTAYVCIFRNLQNYGNSLILPKINFAAVKPDFSEDYLKHMSEAEEWGNAM